MNPRTTVARCILVLTNKSVPTMTLDPTQLDKSMGTLPKSPEDTVKTLEAMFNSAEGDGPEVVNPDFPAIGDEGKPPKQFSLKDYIEQVRVGLFILHASRLESFSSSFSSCSCICSRSSNIS